MSFLPARESLLSRAALAKQWREARTRIADFLERLGCRAEATEYLLELGGHPFIAMTNGTIDRSILGTIYRDRKTLGAIVEARVIWKGDLGFLYREQSDSSPFNQLVTASCKLTPAIYAELVVGDEIAFSHTQADGAGPWFVKRAPR